MTRKASLSSLLPFVGLYILNTADPQAESQMLKDLTDGQSSHSMTVIVVRGDREDRHVGACWQGGGPVSGPYREKCSLALM